MDYKRNMIYTKSTRVLVRIKILISVVMTLFVFLSKANIFVDAYVCGLCLYFIPCKITNNNNNIWWSSVRTNLHHNENTRKTQLRLSHSFEIKELFHIYSVNRCSRWHKSRLQGYSFYATVILLIHKSSLMNFDVYRYVLISNRS